MNRLLVYKEIKYTYSDERMSVIAKPPKQPYYAVIFTSTRTEGENRYANMAKKMEELTSKQQGFLGMKVQEMLV